MRSVPYADLLDSLLDVCFLFLYSPDRTMRWAHRDNYATVWAVLVHLLFADTAQFLLP